MRCGELTSHLARAGPGRPWRGWQQLSGHKGAVTALVSQLCSCAYLHLRRVSMFFCVCAHTLLPRICTYASVRIHAPTRICTCVSSPHVHRPTRIFTCRSAHLHPYFSAYPCSCAEMHLFASFYLGSVPALTGAYGPLVLSISGLCTSR